MSSLKNGDGAAPRDPTAEQLARGHASGAGSMAGAWIAPAAETLAEVFPGLRVIALGGRGGMGAVYRAEQTRLGRAVAVKILPPVVAPDPMARERFEREARLLSGLNHPHVLQIYDFGALPDGTLYLVTEWAEGGDLASLLGGKPQEPARVGEWVAQIASALDAAHARGVVHRDLKPANVLVRADGRLALADFGLAHAQGAGFTTTLTLTGTIFGTFDYMAPEQMTPGQEVTPATDVYALGVMTYQMLTGRVPKGAYVKPSRLVGVPNTVDALIDDALASDPALRPRSAGEFARRLATALAWRGSTRRSWRPTIVAVCLASAVAAVWWWGPWRSGTVRAETFPLVAVANADGTGPAWTDLLPRVRIPEHARRGEWSLRGDELLAGADVCVLRLPAALPTSRDYDVAVEFTRTAGRNSIGVFLPTLSGEGVFELDAWDAGIGGIQMIDGQDMRAHGENFPARLVNGERQRVLLQVRGSSITAIWNGEPRRSWDLRGRRFNGTQLWETSEAGVGLGLCAWRSPTTFHRVAWRAVPAE